VLNTSNSSFLQAEKVRRYKILQYIFSPEMQYKRKERTNYTVQSWFFAGRQFICCL